MAVKVRLGRERSGSDGQERQYWNEWARTGEEWTGLAAVDRSGLDRHRKEWQGSIGPDGRRVQANGKAALERFGEVRIGWDRQ